MPRLQDLYLKYKPCIVRITVVTSDRDLHTGTGFHIGDGLIATARHVVRDVVKENDIIGVREAEIDREIESLTRETDGQRLVSKSIYVHPDKNVDLAVLETDFEEQPFPDEMDATRGARRRPIAIPIGCHVDEWINDKFVLCKVLIMGYPDVPWAEYKVLVTAEAEVNALVRNVRVPHPYFIVSSTARGGFSGAPVINDAGLVIGVIVESLYGNDKPEETGFNAAITIEPLMRILVNRGVRPTFIDDDIWARFLKT